MGFHGLEIVAKVFCIFQLNNETIKTSQIERL